MTDIVFDITLFRTQFPAFSNATTFPDATLQMYWDMATAYISKEDYGYLSGSARVLALNLMTAHLTASSVLIAEGQISGIVDSATIDKVSISLEPPPVRNQWSFWLMTTPYGQQLLALLSVTAVGGFYFGGSPEIGAFRRAGGYSGGC